MQNGAIRKRALWNKKIHFYGANYLQHFMVDFGSKSVEAPTEATTNTQAQPLQINIDGLEIDISSAMPSVASEAEVRPLPEYDAQVLANAEGEQATALVQASNQNQQQVAVGNVVSVSNAITLQY